MHTTIRIHTAAKSGSSILMIYTGGTLGMAYDAGGQLKPFDFGQILENLPEIDRFDFALTVIAFDQPIDSSNVTPAHWIRWAQIIAENYNDYDGFVVLHGTDTMAYSASAMSFLLENLNKPVIFTGAQLPIGSIRTDARENLVTALEIASAKNAANQPAVSEVCIYFHSRLLRGNRAKKVESTQFDAFYSENYPPLAEAGATIEYRPALMQPFGAHRKLRVQDRMDNRVAVLKLFPGMSQLVVENMLQTAGLQAVVLETYGSGNAPTDGWFVQSLTGFIACGATVLNVSQCMGGRVVQGRYATSRQLLEAGVLSGSDITTEAAITKLMYLLAKDLPPEEFRRQLVLPIRGEMTV